VDVTATRDRVQHTWQDSIIPALLEYVRIPNLSPAFDAEWATHGHMDRAAELIAQWVRAQDVPRLTLDIVRLPGRTPLLYIEVPGESPDTVLLYGHLDKQPPMEGWADGLGPWTPVIRDGRLYGRGAADDGYAAFAAVTAIRTLKLQRVPCARCVVLIEASEESGSPDLASYVATLADRIGTPSLVVCLDSGCGDYERLWVTTSLRGLLTGVLTVSVLSEGVHSGAASGIVPSTFRIARQLLERIEDGHSGEMRLAELYADIPRERVEQSARTATVLGERVYSSFPFRAGARPLTGEAGTLLLNRTWRPQLEVVGAGDVPALERAGNVLRPTTSLKLSVRLPPTVDAAAALQRIKQVLEAEPPYGATVRFEPLDCACGWDAPPTAAWLEEAVRNASASFFGEAPRYMGEGGSIPFMNMLGQRFPQAQFLVTGVLGPQSNAHGPNEFLHLRTGMRLTASVAHVLAAHRAAAQA
jgi:acetylornithine deacetylase/succinyl-diaminopimelate desuccinylase-like protein